MEAISAAFGQFPAISIIGFVTFSLILALGIFGFGLKVKHAFKAQEDYEAALDELEAIDVQIAEMTKAAEQLAQDYERSLAEEKAAHDREVFSLQQLVFDRNNEILTLKNDILEIKKYSSYDH